MHISERIELIMNELNFNKNSFSKAIGLSNNVTIGKIINEKRNPSYDLLMSIIQTFDCINPSWLFSEEGEMYRDKFFKLKYSTQKWDKLKGKKGNPIGSPIGSPNDENKQIVNEAAAVYESKKLITVIVDDIPYTVPSKSLKDVLTLINNISSHFTEPNDTDKRISALEVSLQKILSKLK